MAMFIRVALEQMVYGGAALTRHQGKAVFVDGGIAGEEVEVEIREEKADYLIGTLSQILVPSPHRIEPRCSLFGQCGGCQWQHIEYAAQLKFKEYILTEQLRRIGGFENPKVLPIIPMEEPWRYRQKARFGLRTVGEKVSLGFYKTGTRHPIELEDCPVLDSQIMTIYRRLRDDCRRSIKPFVGFCTVEVRSSFQAVQILVSRSMRVRQSFEPMGEAVKGLPPVKGFHQRVLRRNAPLGYMTFFGDPLISYQIDGLSFQVQPTSFFQANREQAERMFTNSIELMEINGGRILDAYCGVGVLTLMAARFADEAVGVEIVPSAIEDARANARINQVTNVRFVEGLFQNLLTRFTGERWDGIILDPPREGVAGRKVLRQLARMGPDRILYVSCNPTTLARDCRRLCEHGYTLGLVQPVDMFPHTYHIEAIAFLEKLPSIS
jgi:23S rRNA (uracil1939-C5)-methyltransferase